MYMNYMGREDLGGFGRRRKNDQNRLYKMF